jgi:hypothetical protein
LTTINGKPHDLENVIATAIAQAADGYVNPPMQAKAALYPNVPDAAHRLMVVYYIERQIGLQLDWQKLNPDDLLSGLTEVVARYNRRAGVRGLVKKYGHASAERIVHKQTGRTIK